MSYLKQHGTRRVPQWVSPPGSDPELGRRQRVGRGLLDAAPPLPRARLRGRLVLRVRVDADPRERQGGRAVHRARTARERSPRSSASRPRAGRRRTTPPSTRSRSPRASATRHAAGRARGAAAGGTNGNAPLPVRGLRRGLPRLGPLAAAGGRTVVHRQAGRRARLPGGEVPAARRHDPPRPAPSRAPRTTDRCRQPVARRVGRARAPVRVDRPRRRDRRSPRLIEGFARAQAARLAARRRRSCASTACRARRSSRST